MLAGVNVALGVSGSIAAVRCVELAHELRRHGATVRAITTPSAESIIHPWSLQFATDRPVVTEITGAVEHVELCGDNGWADVLLLAPTTANTLGKIAGAIDDTPVTTCATTALGAGIPIVAAPAMHEPMWRHDGVHDAIERLESWGVTFVPPRFEEGKAKLASVDAIVTALDRSQAEPTLDGTHIIVTSGATREPIDPVRLVTNRSSGRMGRAIARACHVRGATVTLVHDGPDVPYASVVPVERGVEMHEQTLELAANADAVVAAAAMTDFLVDASGNKLDSSEPFTLDFRPAPKLLDDINETYPEVAIVGFKAEHEADDEALVTAARAQIERVDAAFVVANDASVMGELDSRVILVSRETTETIDDDKPAIAGRIADRLGAQLTLSSEE